MADIPEHKLNGLLKALSEQRRAAAGKKPELHLATRRLLLGEVARVFPKPPRTRRPWRLLLTGWWTRTVAIAGFLVMVFVVVMAGHVFWKNLPRVGDVAMNEDNPPKQFKFTLRNRPTDEVDRLMEASTAEAKAGSKELAKAERQSPAKTGPPAPASAQPQPLVDAATETEAPYPGARPAGSSTPAKRLALDRDAGSTFGAVAAAHARGPRSTTFTPALQPALATGGVVALTESLAAKPQVPSEPARPLAMSSATAEKLASPTGVAAASPPAAPAPTPSSLQLAGLASPAPTNAPVAAPTTLAWFARVDTTEVAADKYPYQQTTLVTDQNRRKLQVLNGEITSAPPAALSSFELKQDGTRIVLIDADGSVYEGERTAMDALDLAQQRTGGAGGGARFYRGGAPSYNMDARSASGPSVKDAEVKDTYAWSFRAAGTNRTLQQAVVIAASVSPASTLAHQEKSLQGDKPGEASTAGQDLPRGLGRAEAVRADAKGLNDTLLLQGTIQVGTNAQQVLRASGRLR